MRTSRTALSLLVALAFTRLAYAEVSWTPTKLNHTAIAGTVSWQEITFVSDSPEPGVALRVVPELAPYVLLSAAGFPALETGRSYRVIAFVTLPLDMLPGLRTGTIHLVSMDGSNRTLARPLPVELSVQRPSLTTIPAQLASPSLDRIRSEDGVTYVAREIEIFFRPGTNLTEIQRVAGSVGGAFLGSLPAERMYQIALPQVTFEDLHELGIRLEVIPSVELAVPNLAMEQFAQPSEGVSSGQGLINLHKAWDITTGPGPGEMPTLEKCRNSAWYQKGPCLGVVDKFIDVDHKDLKDNYAVYRGGLLRPLDSSETIHGTAVASVVGGLANNGLGTAGVLWDTDLFLYEYGSVFGNFKNAALFTDITDALSKALNDGLRVINYSAGLPSPPTCLASEKALQDADRYWLKFIDGVLGGTRAEQVFWIFAAGNCSNDITTTSPARLAAQRSTVASVAAVDGTGALLSSSNHGAVTLAAPGADIRAACSNSADARCSGQDWFLAGASTFQGTSLAAPLVTGTAGLMLSREPGLSANDLRDKLVSSANMLPGLAIPLLDACRAVRATRNENDPGIAQLNEPGPGAAVQPQNGSVTLRWDDAPSCNLVVSYEITLTGGGTTATNVTHYLNPNYLETSFPISQPGFYTWQVVAIDRYERRGPPVARSFNVAPPVLPADLTITKTDTPDPVSSGGSLTYMLNVENIGGSPALNVVVTDTLPTSLTGIQCSTMCTVNAGVVTVAFGALAAGAQTSFTISATAPQTLTTPTSITNTATVTTTSPESSTANNHATATTTVNPPIGELSWIQKFPGTAPAARSGSTMTQDLARENIVLFGGFTLQPSGQRADTWLWNGATWSQAFPLTSPSARESAAMAYDSARARVVLFGGFSQPDPGQIGTINDDTWLWDGASWTGPILGGPRRGYTAMAFDDARDELVLFGGFGTGGAERNDTWVWNGASWRQRLPATSPPARLLHAMAYDEARGEVVLFGGAGAGFFADTWVWNGTTWTQKFPANSPPARAGHQLVYDSVRRRVVLFGGHINLEVGSNTVRYGDTWYWDGTTWSQEFPSSSPSARTGHLLAYDSTRAEVVLFGGNSSSNEWYRNDTWVFPSLTGGPSAQVKQQGIQQADSFAEEPDLHQAWILSRPVRRRAIGAAIMRQLARRRRLILVT